MWQDDNGLWDIPEQHQGHTADFLKVAGATLIGAYIGSKLDNTRFGRWFNTSKFIGFIGKVILMGCIFLAGMYVYEVIKIW